MAMIYLKMGMIDRARDLLKDAGLQRSEQVILSSLLATANDDFDKAMEILSKDEPDQHSGMLALAKQNLALTLLYNGEIGRARTILDHLVDEHESFQTLTINLATLYELMSDRSEDLKLALAGKLAAQGRSLDQRRSFSNADFKL